MSILTLNTLTYKGYTEPVQSGLLTWLDASDASTLVVDGSNRVANWKSKIIRTPVTDFVQTTQSAQPIYNPGVRPYVSFDGANDFLLLNANTNFNSVQSQTTFIVCRPTIVQTAAPARVLFRHAYNTSAVLAGFFNELGNTFHARNSAGGIVGPILGNDVAQYIANTDILLFGEWNAVTDIVRYNTNEYIQAVPATGATNSPTTHVRTRLGCNTQTTADAFWAGHVYEVLHYNKVLTQEELRQTYNYLIHKWNLKI